MLKVKDITQCRNFTWVNPEDNFRIDDTFYWRLEEKAKVYRKANNYPIGGSWQEQFEANVCAHSGGVCSEFVPPSPRQKLETVVRAIGRYAKSGMKTRSAEEVEEIMATHCRPCNYFGGETGLLRIACKKCGCSKLKLFMRSESCPMKYW